MRLAYHPDVDGHHVGYVTSQALFNLHLLNQSWVRVNNVASKQDVDAADLVAEKFSCEETFRNSYVISIHVLGGISSPMIGNVADDIVYVSMVTHVNIARKFNLDIHCNELIDVNLEALHGFSDEDTSSCFADKVDLSPIACPATSGLTLDDDIRWFFQSPILLTPNEIFPIPVRTVKPTRSQYVWFRVNSIVANETCPIFIQTNSRFVSVAVTALSLSGLVNEYVPCCTCSCDDDEKFARLMCSKEMKDAFMIPSSKLSSYCHLLSRGVPTLDVTVLLHGPHGVGKRLLAQKLCIEARYHFLEENAYNIMGDSLAASEQRLENLLGQAQKFAPCVLFIKNIEILGKDKEGMHDEPRVVLRFRKMLSDLTKSAPIFVIGSTCHRRQISRELLSLFTYKVDIEPPSEPERISMLTALLNGLEIADDVSITNLSKISAGLVIGDFIAVLRHALSRSCSKQSDGLTHAINHTLLEESIESIRRSKSTSSASIHIPHVTWDDVGGLADVKKDIIDTIELPMKYPELFRSGLRRSGLLFYGPPGCGKTMLAKAVATEFSLNFFSVKGPELINMYVGQSEENVREVFVKARHVTPCVIFFDELDSLAPNRGRSGDAGGVMDRVVSQLLSELDGMHDNNDVFIIGATNRPDLLDPALLRPGRFDKLIYVGIFEHRDERLRLLRAVTRKLTFAVDVCLEKVVDRCPPNLTGADFYALAADASMNCVRRHIIAHEKDDIPIDNCDVVVNQHDLLTAAGNLVPSISATELDRYKKIRADLLAQRTT